MSGTNSPEAVKKLLENMQSDLRALSLECKKKFPPVKEVSSRDVRRGRREHARAGWIQAFTPCLWPLVLFPCSPLHIGVGGVFHKRFS